MSNQSNIQLISYNTVRQGIGVFAFAFPCALILNSISYHQNILPSISHYYYTSAGTLFTGFLCVFAVFLFTYKGYKADSSYKCNFLPIVFNC